jgi:hypothetical protein
MLLIGMEILMAFSYLRQQLVAILQKTSTRQEKASDKTGLSCLAVSVCFCPKITEQQPLS